MSPFWYFLMRLKSTEPVVNCVDPDQTPHSAASDLGLHRLFRPVCLYNISSKRYMHTYLEISTDIAMAFNL